MEEGRGVARGWNGIWKEALAPLRKGVERLWRFLTSVRLAVILILILANLSLIGTLVIQMPRETAADPSGYAWWLENVVRPKLGRWTTPLAFLRLFDVFHSPWFLGTGALLVVNILACSLNRWKQIRGTLFGTTVKLPEMFYQRSSNRAQFSQVAMLPPKAAAVVEEVLRRRGYRVRMENAPGSLHIAADKNRYLRLGTYLNHLSIVLVILGFLLGSYLGFRNTAFMVPEGSVREVGYGTGLSLSLVSFADEYWPEGPPRDYRSEVVLYKDGAEVRRGVIRVNHPMSYKGVRIYQSFFGQVTVMRVRDSTGKVLYEDGVALGWLSGKKPFQRPTGMFSLPQTGLTAYVLAPTQGYFDPVLAPGQVLVELYREGSSVLRDRGTLDQRVPQNLGGLEFTFVRERQFSGFQVTRDPANLLIWIASGLFMAGLVAVFYLPHRQVWALIQPVPSGGSRVLMRAASGRSFALAQDLASLAEELKLKLPQTESTKDKGA